MRSQWARGDADRGYNQKHSRRNLTLALTRRSAAVRTCLGSQITLTHYLTNHSSKKIPRRCKYDVFVLPKVLNASSGYRPRVSPVPAFCTSASTAGSTVGTILTDWRDDYLPDWIKVDCNRIIWANSARTKQNGKFLIRASVIGTPEKWDERQILAVSLGSEQSTY